MRLIDADTLPRHGKRGGIVHWKDIENAPSIDIVRCGECKWYDNREGCFFSTSEIDPEGFCSFGERREQ